MRYRELLRQSKALLATDETFGKPLPPATFASGARWMHRQLQRIDATRTKAFDPTINFAFHGFVKYATCLCFCVGSAIVFSRISLFLLPLSILIFYLVEVQMLFLFPLLIDGVSRPYIAGWRATQKLGNGRALLMVIPVAAYMLLGFARVRDPFRGWYTGCMAILLLYVREVSHRSQPVV